MRKYSRMSPEDPVAQGLLKVHFVTKAWPDRQKKLLKVGGWRERSLEMLLQEDQKVYVRREDEKEKQRAKLMVFTVYRVEGWRQRGSQGELGPGWKGQEER